MAKKKPAATTTSAPAKPEKAVKPTAAKKSPTSKAATPKAATNGAANGATPSLGHHQIGATAGAVWSVLSEKGDATLATLKKEIDAPADLVLAAVGWLAREEKLEFSMAGKNTKLALK